jgi:SAM-dependent methyltransferase
MSATPSLPGRAGRLRDLTPGNVEIADIYGTAGSHVYDAITRTDRHEIRELVTLVRPDEGELLELGCGSGRLTLPLLASGWRVTALDYSPEMLTLLAGRLARLGERLRARCTLVRGDMSDFGLAHHFAAVVLGTSSVTLLDGPQRASLFGAVRRHLTPHGRFFLSTVELGDEVDTELLVDGHTLFEHVDLAAGRRSVIIVPRTGGRWYSTSTYLLAAATLTAELAAASLTVTAVHTVIGGDPQHRTVLLEARSADR